ncbi:MULTISPECIES: D-aminoacylase [unclassified Streptomyces]|jgi:N-acyl-D-aspartate/D-glutamate deacylase|uniref:N-acyl-D-amino-acid deacylase family protein n=1 Tax=unclassified Streptomyces TaxID=2593676 RepID=UPI001BB0B591|nr:MULTISPECIES: D-aminoacylase [unclassified Streptomyces]MDH6450897.1 N-acyl-D-aspartate/D-glutamate deacylase [Streptomyces sp. SAI-119]MDH6498550.1 N-acyl-D-aspartate/D-glutamate deacylase [Streptomyces sp. SAI-149]QUC62627.1 D-aminoacylase [Streptomyces sp. A2-16]GLP71433.1 amidohydrolase [Streptomyces sp. TUS-ST3]
MLDHLIKGATVVDGTGAPARTADVGIRDGRIAVVGQVTEEARTSEDAGGLVLAPGFVDPHTHYDAQLFWDPYATPSLNHGVTTVAAGNCGFTLAPLNPDRPDDADYTRRMMSKVEGMSLVALEEGAPWNWQSFGDYLDALEGRIAVNAGFMVGHCALRRYVMGPDAVGGQPSEEQLAQMLRLFHEAMDAGAWGFSTTQSSTHSDGDGKPVASRHALPAELLALSRAVGEHEGTQIEAIVAGCLDQFSDAEIDLFVEMSAAAGRPLNWNVLTIDSSVPERVPRQLFASEQARKAGGRVVALTMPILTPMNMSLGTFCALNLIPGWGPVLALPVPERIEKLRDPDVQTELVRLAESKEAGVFRRLTNFGRYVIGDTYSEENRGLSGRVVEDIAAERGQTPFGALVEICAADSLRTVLWPMPTDNDPASWAMRAEAWQHEDVLLGGSDAGAHLDRMCGAPYTTRFLGDCLRGRRLTSLEQAVKMLTDDPARLFGLRERGRIEEGFHADLVLFDPERIAAGTATLVHDLPGDSPRLDSKAIGVRAVWVNGVEAIRDDVVSGAVPGRVLRSGRDTRTVSTR